MRLYLLAVMLSTPSYGQTPTPPPTYPPTEPPATAVPTPAVPTPPTLPPTYIPNSPTPSPTAVPVPLYHTTAPTVTPTPTSPSSPTNSSSTPTNSSSDSPTNSSSTPTNRSSTAVGSEVGIAVAVLVVVAVGLALYVRYRRKRTGGKGGEKGVGDSEFPYVAMVEMASPNTSRQQPQQQLSDARSVPVLTPAVAGGPVSESPSFDSIRGFPLNAAAVDEVVRFWHGEITRPDKKSFAFMLPHAVLAEATGGFSGARRIGGGGSCEVYKAVVFTVEVAVKALTDTAGVTEKEKVLEEKQFLAEQKLLMEVFHPNICRLLGVSTDGPQRCLVLELCPAGSLYDVLKEDAAKIAAGATPVLGWRKRVQIAVAIARALAHLHAQSPPMIHRDVKSQNVLLTTTACDDMAAATKVSDFGTVREDVRGRKDSKLSTSTHNRKSHGTTDHIIGTRPYMPYEYVSMGRVSEKTDTFSYGILLIELCTDAAPSAARWVVEDCADTVEKAVMEHDGALALRWPGPVLEVLAGVAGRCCVAAHCKRTAIAAELPALERLYEVEGTDA